jgi:hypothetical protein
LPKPKTKKRFSGEDLCGLCVLCGNISFFFPGGHGDFYNLLSKNMEEDEPWPKLEPRRGLSAFLKSMNVHPNRGRGE